MELHETKPSGGISRSALWRRIEELGVVLHQGAHARVVRLAGDGPVVVALLSEAHGADWLELRVWAAGSAAASTHAILERNARLAYGAFCLVDGELYLRAVLDLASLGELALVRAIDGLLAELDLLGQVEAESTATLDLFGYLA